MINNSLDIKITVTKLDYLPLTGSDQIGTFIWKLSERTAISPENITIYLVDSRVITLKSNGSSTDMFTHSYLVEVYARGDFSQKGSTALDNLIREEVRDLLSLDPSTEPHIVVLWSYS